MLTVDNHVNGLREWFSGAVVDGSKNLKRGMCSSQGEREGSGLVYSFDKNKGLIL